MPELPILGSGKLDLKAGGPGFELFRYKDDKSPVYDHTDVARINAPANWRRTVPAFARELDYARRERSLYWHDQATGLAQKAVELISTILHSESAAPSLRLRAALKILAIASDPQPAPMKPFPTSAAEAEAITGRSMILQTLTNESENSENLHNSAQSAQNCTIQTSRRPPEPSRNALCPCKSGLKFKRCCANLVPSANSAKVNSA